ncbi:flagellar motor protein [Tuberibacillus sp. Marseille-P3662]|uniref:flagellar motor protein n=1 Tax=Tuberibacillus sp. Marseille-P3662 TaxID=1965358 RepID=UPI000A1CCCAE|nr:flagellar motor protein [Tuberibacillus sp. Marseille-P3662]
MDVTTIIGLFVGILSLVVGFLIEGGTLGSLLQETAAIIVFGGTIGAVIISFPLKTLKKVPFIIKYAFTASSSHSMTTVENMVELSNVSRRQGLLALETQQDMYEDDPFLSEGIRMIVDGVEGETIKDILNREIELYERRMLSIGKVFETAGGFAPTMGIIGTVMGLVHVLGSLDNPSALGPAIAVAFIATLYGVASANVIYLPIFNKIKARLDDDLMIKELQAEGLISIQYGENSTLLRNKLMAFIDDEVKSESEQVEDVNVNA